MALSIDSPFGHIPATINTTTTSDPISGSYAVGANTKALIVMIFYASNVQRTGGAPDFSGQTMTQLESLAGVTEAVCEMWWLQDPSVSGSWVNIPNTNTRAAFVHIASISAASGQTINVDATGINETTAANPTVQVVTTVADALTIACVATGDNAFAPTASRGTIIYTDDPAAWGGGSQYLSGSAIGTLNMNWTEATSDDYGAIGAAFKEVQGIPVLVVADATQTLTSDKVSLTQHYSIAVSNATHVLTSDSISLPQHYANMVVSDATQLMNSDKVSIAFIPLLILQDTTQLMNSDNVALTPSVGGVTLQMAHYRRLRSG